MYKKDNLPLDLIMVILPFKVDIEKSLVKIKRREQYFSVWGFNY